MTAKNSPVALAPILDMQRVVAAIFCLVTSLVGVGISVHLTRIKFQMLYTPCMTGYGGCQVGSMSCDDALGSPAAMLWGLPISLWGAGFYLVTAVAAALVLRRGAFGGTAAHLLVCLGGFAVLVSALLGGYTALALTALCPFCLSLYVVSVLVFGGSLLVYRAPGGPSVTFREVPRTRLADALDGVFALVMIAVISTGLLSLGFHGLRNVVDAQDGCPEPVAGLPSPSIRVGSEQPAAILALFVDLTCTKCRSEFKKLWLPLQDKSFPAPVQIWVYHTPRHACDPEAFPGGYDRSNDAASYDNACLAARAAECMEKLQPGAGFELMGMLFALHDDRLENTPLFTAERIGNKAVELGMEIDPDDGENPLFRCIDHDGEVLDRVTEHQRYADVPGFSTPTLMIYHAAEGVPDLSRKPLVANANTSQATVMEYVAQQADVGAPP